MISPAFPSFNIVLYQPEIPANTGNIGRLCVGSDAILHLVKPFKFLMDDKSLKRAGLDYWQDLNLIIHNDLDFIYSPERRGNVYYCTTKTTKSYLSVAFEPGDWFIFGPESRGLPETLLIEQKDSCITIPMTPLIRSINLSNSVAIILFEAIRQNLPC